MDGGAGNLVPRVEIREGAERQREVARADEDHVDAFDRGDLAGVLHAALGLDHDDGHDAALAGLDVVDEVPEGPDAAAGARAVRRIAGRLHGLARLLGGLDQRHDHAFGAGIERLPDRHRRVLGDAHEDGDVRGHDADGLLHRLALPQPVLRVENDGVGARAHRDFAQGDAAEREPDDAQRLALVEAVSQGGAAGIEHVCLLSPRSDTGRRRRAAASRPGGRDARP